MAISYSAGSDMLAVLALLRERISPIAIKLTHSEHKMTLSSTLLLACLATSLVISAHGHAYLAYPPSRNYQAFLKQDNSWCPHCGQGGGTGHVPSMCGDPFQNVVGDPTFVPFINRFYGYTTLTQGQELDIKITVSTNHGGRMRMAICPLPRNQVTQACFDNPENWLHRVNTDPKYNDKVYWYLNTNNNLEAVERFKLPAGISCDNGCMMQWWWVGEQSCVLNCESSTIDVPGECHYNPLNPSVDTCTSLLQTEQFYNCADIIIKSSNSNGSPAPTPSPTPSPSPASKPPTPKPVARPPSPKAAPKPPSPKLATPKPPAPQQATPKPPAPKQATPPTPIPADAGCPASDMKCVKCVEQANKNSAGKSLIAACYKCSMSADASGCQACMTSSTINGVISGCLDCITGGQPAWKCNQNCALKASNASQMQQCNTCIQTPGVNSWGCQNCLEVAGNDSSQSSQCTACVQLGLDAWSCGACLKKSTATAVATCFSCLAKAGANTASCL